MTTSKRTTRRAGGAHSENGSAPSAQAAAPKPAKPRARRPKAPVNGAPTKHEDRQASIAKAAYFRSQLRGFEPGYELEDWLAAEAEVDRRIAQ
jgi:hypothetical protein